MGSPQAAPLELQVRIPVAPRLDGFPMVGPVCGLGRSFLTDNARVSDARSFLQRWPKAVFPAQPNHAQWQMDFFVRGSLTCRVHFEPLTMVSSLSSTDGLFLHGYGD